MEAEVEDALGRGYYEDGAATGAGYRNGYWTGRLKTAEGPIAYAAPQVASRAEPFRSALREGLQGRTEALEELAVELFARGLSTRDIADVFTDGAGRPLFSRIARSGWGGGPQPQSDRGNPVSQLSERLWAEYQAFASRDLAEHDIVDLFVDGIAERLRPGQPREPVLAAWGIARDGRKVLLHLMAGSREDVETVRAFFQDMRSRGLNEPLLVVTDGAPGIIRAAEECFPRAARQR